MKVGESYIFVHYLCYRLQNSIPIHPVNLQKVTLYHNSCLESGSFCIAEECVSICHPEWEVGCYLGSKLKVLGRFFQLVLVNLVRKVRCTVVRGQLTYDGTRAETIFRLSAKRTSTFNP